MREVLFGTGIKFNPFNFFYCLVGGMGVTYYLAFVDSSFVHTVLGFGFFGTLLVQLVLIFVFGVWISISVSVLRPVFFMLKRLALRFWNSLDTDPEKS